MKNITKTLVKILFMFLLTIFTTCKEQKKEDKNKNSNERVFNKTNDNNIQSQETGIIKTGKNNKVKDYEEKVIETSEGNLIKKYYKGNFYEWEITLPVDGSKEKARYKAFQIIEERLGEKYDNFFNDFINFLETKNLKLGTTILYKIMNDIPKYDDENENNVINKQKYGEYVFERFLIEKGANPAPDIFEKTLDFQFLYMDHTIRKFTILLAYGFAPDLKKDSPFFKKLTSRFNEISDDIYGYNDNFTEKYNKVFLKNYSQKQSFLYLYIPEPDKTILEITSNATSPGDGVAVYHILQKTPPPKENAQIITNLIIKDFFKTLCYELLSQKQRKPLAKSFYDYIVENEILDDAKIIEKLKDRVEMK